MKMKEYRVKVFIAGQYSEVNIKANNGTGAIAIAKKMFVNGRVITAQQIK
jgi:hypothetical protein